uniref:Uncharacterized protein n=1 Tax=Rhizophora mucronata TaxID=61149 RepID=A0A2P2QD53_RHIMU
MSDGVIICYLMTARPIDVIDYCFSGAFLLHGSS